MDRKTWLSILAKADTAELSALWDALALAPAFSWLRRPQIGAVMVQGRAGGTGAAFNLGEMTVTRCTLQLENGPVGVGYVQGRDAAKAEIAALADALLQTAAAQAILDGLIEPLRAKAQARKAGRAAKADATRVDFFTLVRGEDG
ncbi:phosphonate C-P lyase system protein PhnG [Aliishimia ponticola]|uniref:Phosphonate C-P lyase system protein PhnG n=1 Tax=Aliishimia ponticola TaxID=2499833 RepID=A0A4S4NEJ8_9RHOB|nr:phosphonate C-P lyase system protein PhnG [Aliishimia ponticola]THH37185.1 phosphonate C-P lyase system protein PhnG [Aliishimia ponticola]